MSGPYYQPGAYWGRITSHRVEPASTGTPQLILRFEVVGIVNPSDTEGTLLPVTANYERTVWQCLTNKEQNAIPDFVVEQLSVLGFDGTNSHALDDRDPERLPLIGKELAFYCKHEPKQEKVGKDWVNTTAMKESWQISNVSSGSKKEEVDPLDAKGFRKLDALFGKALNMNPGAVAQAKQVQAEQAAPEPTMENVDVAPAATQPPVVDMTVPEGEDDIPF